MRVKGNLELCLFRAYLTAMRFIARIIEKLQRHPKRVVFPEGTEPRVLQAARQFYSLRLGDSVLLGDRTAVKQAAAELNVSLGRGAHHQSSRE